MTIMFWRNCRRDEGRGTVSPVPTALHSYSLKEKGNWSFVLSRLSAHIQRTHNSARCKESNTTPSFLNPQNHSTLVELLFSFLVGLSSSSITYCFTSSLHLSSSPYLLDKELTPLSFSLEEQPSLLTGPISRLQNHFLLVDAMAFLLSLIPGVKSLDRQM